VEVIGWSSSKIVSAVALSHEDGLNSAVVLLLKAALIQVSDYRLLGASGFLGAIHEKHKFKYFKNLTVKLIDRNLFNPIFNTKVVLMASPLFNSVHCFARDYLQNRIFRYARYFIIIQQQHSQVY
jgi:hypothetical protein